MGKTYRLYIDESGDHAYGKKEALISRDAAGKVWRRVGASPSYSALSQPDKRYLCLLGCIIETDYYRSILYPTLEALKQKHFPHGPDDAIIFHRQELMSYAGPFWRLRESSRRELFNRDILSFFSETHYVVIAVVIDKKAHVERYGHAAFHPYHFCLGAMLDRYCGFLQFYEARGDVMAESRGGDEDMKLKSAYSAFYNEERYGHEHRACKKCSRVKK